MFVVAVAAELVVDVDAFIELEEVEDVVDEAAFVANFAVVATLATLGFINVDEPGIGGLTFFSPVTVEADVALALFEGFSTSAGLVGAYTGTS